MNPQIKAPAPWTLTGKGLVMLYHFPALFNRQYGFMEAYQQHAYQGWVGAVMFMDYRHSNVGTYRELLFLPGIFRLGGRYSFSVSKIWVSTEESVWNGRKNWGIPKNLAQFNIEQQEDGSRVYTAAREGKTFFTTSVITKGPMIPFTTRLLPWTRICQQSPEGLLLTSPEASGKAQLAALQNIQTDAAFFPPVDRLKPLLVLSANDFIMRFPVAWRLP